MEKSEVYPNVCYYSAFVLLVLRYIKENSAIGEPCPWEKTEE
jgi:hypothetical protein